MDNLFCRLYNKYGQCQRETIQSQSYEFFLVFSMDDMMQTGNNLSFTMSAQLGPQLLQLLLENRTSLFSERENARQTYKQID